MCKIVISLLLIFVLLISCSDSSSKNDQLAIPKLKVGDTKLSGQILNWDKGISPNISIQYWISPFTIEPQNIDLDINDQGYFSASFLLEMSPSLVDFRIDSDRFTLFLEVNKETELEIYLGKANENRLQANEKNIPLNNMDYLSNDLFAKMALLNGEQYDILTPDSLPHFIADPQRYINYSLKDNLNPRLAFAEKDTVILELERQYIMNCVKIMFAEGLLEYRGGINTIHKFINAKHDTSKFIPPFPPISYYGFLKGFNLNNPQYLYTERHYTNFMQALLRDRILNIPPIEETAIEQWLSEVKLILAEPTGINDGIFYDVLIGNAYSKQFSDEIRPLSNKQIEMIKGYYKSGAVEKILLRENEQIKHLAYDKHATIVNSTPNVDKENLLKTIISKYKDKVVFLDFWATWCGPCIQAMSETRSIKANLKDCEVAFVYLTTESSPSKIWKDKILSISGEHYYLTLDEWNYLLEYFNISGIPSYQFYDKKGELKEQVTGFPGVEYVENKIQGLLSE